MQTALNGKADSFHGTHVSYSSTTPKMDGTASAGSADTVARSDHVHPSDTGKANTSHTHTKSNITDFPSSLTASDVYSWAKASSKLSYSWSEISSKPSTFSPGSHNHDAGNINSGILSASRGGTGNSTGYVRAGLKSETKAGGYSTAEGNDTEASGYASHAEGYYTKASAYAQFVIGKFNVKSVNESDTFIIGKGGSNDSRSNCFRVTHTGTYASGNYNASGADYAECFEWEDENPDNEDRVGRFVTLEGEKIHLANETDDFILGIVSGDSSIIGDVYDDQWKRIYLFDVFGRPIWEDVEIFDEYIDNEELDENKNIVKKKILIEKAHIEHTQKLNPAYNSEEKYISRSERPEWDAIGLLGKLVMVDDGTCKTNGWAKPGTGGMAAAPETITKFLVMSRIDESHIRVLIL